MSSENYSVMKISEKIHCLKINFTITISPEKKDPKVCQLYYYIWRKNHFNRLRSKRKYKYHF